jgi:double zinc ribbon protein
MIALLLGTILAVGALAFVLAPLFSERALSMRAPRPLREPEARASAVEALREIEFDRETGKLSDADYTSLKAAYTRQAIEAMRSDARAEASAAARADSDDAAEAAILAYRSRRPACQRCGPRPEWDALYCSDCGSYLAGACASCGAKVEEAGARFCSACGHVLAA